MDSEESSRLDKSLQALHDFLKENKFVCLLSNANEPPLSQHLLISLGADEQGREIILRMNFLLIPDTKEPNTAFPLKKDAFLQFVMILPFQAEKKSEREALRMLVQLNAALEIPGFGFNEVLNEFHFRYVFFSYEEYLDKEWLLSLIMYFRTIFDLFGSWIEKIAKGEMTLDEFMVQSKNMIPIEHKDTKTQRH